MPHTGSFSYLLLSIKLLSFVIGGIHPNAFTSIWKESDIEGLWYCQLYDSKTICECWVLLAVFQEHLNLSLLLSFPTDASFVFYSFLKPLHVFISIILFY